MAGFDFKFPVPIEDRDYAKALLRSAQIRASKTHLDLRFSWHNRRKSFPFNHYYVAINGDLLSIELFAKQMLRFCQGFQEGYAANSRRFRKSSTPMAFAGCLYFKLSEFRSSLEEFSGLIREKVRPFSLNSVSFIVPKASGLRKSMKALSDCFVSYFLGEASSEQLVEQVHSSSEHLMSKLFPSLRDATYRSLLAKSRDGKHISLDQFTALLNVKSFRRNAKHRGQNVSDDSLQPLLQPSIGAIHSLTSQLSRQYPKDKSPNGGAASQNVLRDLRI
jgi:hypothetical protein